MIFQKNLELKEKLCEAAEKLAEEADVVSAFHQLQKLHQEFRNIGPVAKDLREKVWARFQGGFYCGKPSPPAALRSDKGKGTA